MAMPVTSGPAPAESSREATTLGGWAQVPRDDRANRALRRVAGLRPQRGGFTRNPKLATIGT